MKENIPSLMLFIDFQKAFDSVEWEFLNALRHSILVQISFTGLESSIKIY